MKNYKILFLFLAIAFVATSCVSSKKYKELDALYQKCTDDLNYTTSEKIDFENKSKELASEIVTLKVQIEKLKEDTTAMGRRIRIAENQLNKMKGDYDELLKSFTDQNLTFINTLQEREKELAEKEARLAELQNILAQKDAEVKALKNKVTNALKGFEDHGLTIYEKNGKVYVSLDEKLLFASGSWEIDNRGKEALAELGKVLAQDTDINVMIEGHTDNVPFRGSGNVKDNWDLSVMRATAVVKEVLKNKGIDPQRVTAAGRSEYVPIDPADTREARARNRRTEIILTPKLDELFRIIDSQ
ncbi:MAG: OmpA family protein [Bacteroidetes bacterium]|nr:OmpA family protein [Bacteroidota bacterium]MCL2302034.1 OmpA family protein [Lentimicrobiaceae bacterium]